MRARRPLSPKLKASMAEAQRQQGTVIADALKEAGTINDSTADLLKLVEEVEVVR